MVHYIVTCPDPVRWLSTLGSRMRLDDSGCWIWTGPLDHSGYGKFRFTSPSGEKRDTGAHRASWLAHRGDIPAGLVVDHLCRIRACINPWHMDPVTSAVNTARSEIVGKRRSPLSSHCKAGHAYSEHGATATTGGGYVRRVCRACAQDRMRRFKERRAAA